MWFDYPANYAGTNPSIISGAGLGSIIERRPHRECKAGQVNGSCRSDESDGSRPIQTGAWRIVAWDQDHQGWMPLVATISGNSGGICVSFVVNLRKPGAEAIVAQ